MRNRSVSMDDIAKALGVSKNAVSLALRGKDGVSEDLRQKIAAKAREMGYGQEKQQASQYILALIPQRNTHLLDGMFYQQVCFHMESYARSKGYLLTICSVSVEEEKACLLHSRIGAPGAMRCRSWPTGRNRRLYIFYTFDQTAARDRQSFIVFGVYENKVYFSKYTNPEWQNRVKDGKEFQDEPQMRPPWKNRMENAP